MKNQMRIAIISRLVARIWGSLILLNLLIFVDAHVLGGEGSGDGGFNSAGERLIFYLTFPVGTMVGLAIAWKWEGMGGLITAGGIIGLFIMRPDLMSDLSTVGVGLIGLLYLIYWTLKRDHQFETTSMGKGGGKIKRNNIGIALLISLLPLGVFGISMIQKRDKSFITIEKDSSYNKVERVEVIVKVEEPLIPFFANSFEHSLSSALESNGVKAVVTVNSSGLGSLSDNDKDERGFMPDATLRIHIQPLYRKRDDGYEAIVGTDYEASLIDIENEKRVWRATGNVNYIVMYSSNYKAGEGTLKEFAWSTTAAIVNAFVAEVNDQEPTQIYTVTEERERHGQRAD